MMGLQAIFMGGFQIMRGALAQGTGEALDFLETGMLMIMRVDPEMVAVAEMQIVGPRTPEAAAVIG